MPTTDEIIEASMTNSLIAGEDVTINGDRTKMPDGQNMVTLANHLLAREDAAAAAAAEKTPGIFQANFNNT